ncbi:helix-turn-helix domain-containing protein [Streptomyces sp. 1331.2]|uniref:helix-turn-helix domain-containing protein n=1 Tax=Streptomyces sp. 1331.2 TaxID=1938835 RepID=UPI00359C3F3B
MVAPGRSGSLRGRAACCARRQERILKATLENTEPGRQRRLASLGPELNAAQRELAEHLRVLRTRAGLSSGECAARLSSSGRRVDHTRFSKFLNGREIPPVELAPLLHGLVAECEGAQSEPKTSREPAL